MKKCVYLLMFVFTTTICLGQTKEKVETKPKDLEIDIKFKLDSLSKVYKMKILSYGTITRDEVTRQRVGSGECNEIKKKYIPKPVN
jgi:hypothetical protein